MKRQLDKRPDFSPPSWTRLQIGSKVGSLEHVSSVKGHVVFRLFVR
jgi:hypothetical protein